MSEESFADRYAAAGLSPTATIIQQRQAPAERIATAATVAQILDLALGYYGSARVDLKWFRDEFANEDTSFSLVNNERESKLLVAIILRQLVDVRNPAAILAVVAGHVQGHRSPSEAAWLVADANAAMLALAVDERAPQAITRNVAPPAPGKLETDVAGIADWEALKATLLKLRTESQTALKNVAAQTSSALAALERQVRMQGEEGQMLWWVISGYSRCLERPFATLPPHAAAIVASADLAALTTASKVGPVAAPALLHRVIPSSENAGGTAKTLSDILDNMTRDDLQRLKVNTVLPPELVPIATAITLVEANGPGAWQGRFGELSGLDSSLEWKPDVLGAQLYRELLLGKLHG